MLIKSTLNAEQLTAIAQGLGADTADMHSEWMPRKKVYKTRGRFVPGEARDRYKRVSASIFGNERRVHALCWHGFLDIFRAIFAEDPNARIETAMETWYGLDHLEHCKEDAYWRQAGSQMYPVAYGELCRCERQGECN